MFQGSDPFPFYIDYGLSFSTRELGGGLLQDDPSETYVGYRIPVGLSGFPPPFFRLPPPPPFSFAVFGQAFAFLTVELKTLIAAMLFS